MLSNYRDDAALDPNFENAVRALLDHDDIASATHAAGRSADQRGTPI